MGPIFSKFKSNKSENLNNNVSKQDDKLESNNDIENENETVIINTEDIIPTPTIDEPTVESIFEPTPTIDEPTVEPIIEPTVESIVFDPTPTIDEPTVEPIIEPTVESIVVEPTVDPTPTVIEPIVEEMTVEEPTLTIVIEPIVEQDPEDPERSVSNESVDKAVKRKRRKCRQKY